MMGGNHCISLLHATRKRVTRALACKKMWLEAATLPERIEHIFAIDPDDDESAAGLQGHTVVRVVGEGQGCVGAWNLAAQHSTGQILVQLSDDWVPQKGWDVEFERRLRDVSQPAVLRVSDGHRLDDLLCMAIFTRPWLEVLGTFLHKDYFSMYSDDEFSYRSYKAGVVIDARDILLEHEHPTFDTQVTEDETYKRQNSSASYKRGHEAFVRRNPDAMGRWLHEGTALRYYLPEGHEAGEKGRVLLTSDALKLKQEGVEWRRFARKYEVLLMEKQMHVQLFRQFAASLIKLLSSIGKSFRGRMAMGREARGKLDALLSEWKLLEAGDENVGASIEAILKLSQQGVSLLDEAAKRGWPGRLVDGGLVKAFRAQATAQQKWWEGVKSVVADVKSNKSEAAKIRAAYAPPVLHGGIPVYIISFNQLTYLRNMVSQLLGLGVATEDIHVVDNKSSLPPLLDYLTELESCGCQVHRMERNLGPRGVFDPEAGLSLPEVFAVTDPDLQFHADTPRTFREDMMHIAAWCGVWKCGCALNINERDDFVQGTYFQGKTIAEWEGNFWHDPIPGWPEALESRPSSSRGPVFRASVDTTFAVYIRDREHEGFLESVRVAGCFEARHLPWYVAALDESGAPAMSRLRDGRPRPRPSPGEMKRYRLEETSSTISKMMPGSKAEIQWVCQPGTQYEWAIPSGACDAQWWSEVFERGWKDDLLRLLRERTTCSKKPVHMMDIGSPAGAIALWGAMRCGHVHAMAADVSARDELKASVVANRFEHCVSVHERIVSADEVGDFCRKLISEAGDKACWLIHASCDGDQITGVLSGLAKEFPSQVTGLIFSSEKAVANIPWETVEGMRPVSGDGWRGGWREESHPSKS